MRQRYGECATASLHWLHFGRKQIHLMCAWDEKLPFGSWALCRCQVPSSLRRGCHINRGRLLDRVFILWKRWCEDLSATIRVYSLIHRRNIPHGSRLALVLLVHHERVLLYRSHQWLWDPTTLILGQFWLILNLLQIYKLILFHKYRLSHWVCLAVS